MADGMTASPMLVKEPTLMICPPRAEEIEMREESTRRHEELRQILLANASARESVSFNDLA